MTEKGKPGRHKTVSTKRLLKGTTDATFFFLIEDFGTFKDKFATVVARKFVLLNYLCCRT